MIEETFDIVDMEDTVIQQGITKSNIDLTKDIIRVATLFLYDKNGHFVMSQRVGSKTIDPNLFEAPAHGKVLSNENQSKYSKSIKIAIERLNTFFENPDNKNEIDSILKNRN